MDRRLTRQGEARKAQLLEHAARLFAERGYHRTRVIDIVRSAGVAKGLFYWYFDNKDALFRDLIGDLRHRLRREQADAVRLARTPLGQLYAGTTASVHFMARHRELYSLLQIEGQTGARFASQLHESTATHAHDTAAIIEAGQRDGAIRGDDDPLTLAHAVLATVMHLVYFHRTGRLDGAIEELAATAAKFVVHGLAASDALARAAEDEVLAAPVALTGS